MSNKKNKNEVFVLLHDIRSVHNVGSIWRTANTAGVSKIFLSGYTPLPVDRFGRERKDFAKVALGSQKSVSWEYAKNPISLVKRLKKEGVFVVAIEQAKNSVDYKKVKIKKPVLFLVGNEVDGVPKNLLNLIDVIAEIPMKGDKESLNVSVAFGIALFRTLRI
ncbi:MAG: TrmH family RNA methyltransferase [Patescibacteria group bacterium]|nr:TrmH family RNA methyltransferase [Patescibacteria group bacterium]MDE1988820.1 TrmH family RNA methyltransferase [Patescibacteria group bacterium]MDE2218625.1 TrmH family RNA methyltransferase [Patescibacteria group bacterium]